MKELFSLEGEALQLVKAHAKASGLSLRESVITLLVVGALAAKEKQAALDSQEQTAHLAEVKRLQDLAALNAQTAENRRPGGAKRNILRDGMPPIMP